MRSVANNHDVKKNNRLNTLKTILTHKRISQPALAKILGHSGPTVLQNIKELNNLGLIQEAGDLESTGGRKAKAWEPIAQAKYSIGLDITKNHLILVLIDMVTNIIHSSVQRKQFTPTDDYFRSLADLTNETLQQLQIPLEKITGIGISLPGTVDQEQKLLLSSHVFNLKNYSTENFSRYLPTHSFFINDANAAGYAEAHRLNNPENFVYLSLSNSVGGAIINSKKLYIGDKLKAGEFGHMTLIPDGLPCYCGKHGCFDAYCNAEVLSSYTNGNLEQFFQKQEHNKKLQNVWEQYQKNLAVIVNNLHLIFDCDVMVGGYIGSYLPRYAPNFRAILAKRNTFEPDCAYLKYCTYSKQEAAATGAALLPLEQYLQEMCK